MLFTPLRKQTDIVRIMAVENSGEVHEEHGKEASIVCTFNATPASNYE
jgi:hypothetical protein